MITNEILCLIGFGIMGFVIYSLYQYIDNGIEQNVRKIIKEQQEFEKRLQSFHTCIQILEQKIKDGPQNKVNCCKAGIEKSNYEMFKIDDRLRTIEQWLFTKEYKNENGERIISVVTPELKDIPITSDPLGNTGKRPEDGENFYIKSDVDRRLTEKYEDFNEIMTEENVARYRINNPLHYDHVMSLTKDLYLTTDDLYLKVKCYLKKDKK